MCIGVLLRQWQAMECGISEASALLPAVPTVAASAVAAGAGAGGPSGNVQLKQDPEDDGVINSPRGIGLGTPAIQTKSLHVLGSDVSIICISFSDKIFVTISDNGKMAAMVRALASGQRSETSDHVRDLFRPLQEAAFPTGSLASSSSEKKTAGTVDCEG